MKLPALDDALLKDDPIAAAVRRPPAVPLRDQLACAVRIGRRRVDPPPVEPLQRETGRHLHLSEHRRLELMLLPRMLYRVMQGSSDDKHPDAQLVCSLLRDAMTEPLNGLPLAQVDKLLRRINQRARRLMDEHFAQMMNAKIAAILYFAIQQMLETGVLELYEGSSMADALALMLPMFEYAIATAAADRSARKQARRFISTLQREGYFQ
jgi:hypothetical protein